MLLLNSLNHLLNVVICCISSDPCLFEAIIEFLICYFPYRDLIDKSITLCSNRVDNFRIRSSSQFRHDEMMKMVNVYELGAMKMEMGVATEMLVE